MTPVDRVRPLVTPPEGRPGAAELVADGALTMREAAAFAGVGITTLYNAMAAGQLAWVKVGRRRLIPRRALTAFLAARLRGGWAEGADPAVGPDAAPRAARPLGTIT
jgi:excisionase family DNA binding protein